MKVKLINGPNINLLGRRELEIYGEKLYNDVVTELISFSKDRNIDLDVSDYSSEGEIIDSIANLKKEGYDALIINPGAYTHYSIAIMDSLKACDILKIEVHISNVSAREEYRQKLLTTSACDGMIMGLGIDSYKLAVEYIKMKGDKNEFKL